MEREKVDNKLNVVIGTKAQIEGDTSIPENSIIIVTDEELKADEIVYSVEKNVEEAIEDLEAKLNTIEEGAQKNVGTNLGITRTGTTNTITSSTGSNTSISGATTSQAGLVTTGVQTFGGEKTFVESIKIGTGTKVWETVPSASTIVWKDSSDTTRMSLSNTGILDVAIKDQNDTSAIKFWTGTQEQYDAIGSPSADVVYLITE